MCEKELEEKQKDLEEKKKELEESQKNVEKLAQENAEMKRLLEQY